MDKKPLLVSIDTATRYAGLAVFDGNEVLSETFWRANQNHSVELAPELVRMLGRQGATASDVGAVAVALGPGSFTGLRIGLSLAKGLATAQRIPIFGVPTLDVLAFQHAEQRRPIWSVIQAGRSRLCAARYERRRGRWRQHSEIHLTTIEGLTELITGRCLICGELGKAETSYIAEHNEQDIQFAIPSQSMRRPACLAELAWRRFEHGESDDIATLSPIYIHPS